MNKDNKFFGYLKTRGAGFWLTFAAAILSLVTAFVYMGTFIGLDRYWSAIVFLLPLFATAAYGLAFYKYTAKYTGVAMFVFMLAGLLMTVDTVYYHIADVVFKAGEGVSVFKAVGGNVTFLFVAYIIDLVVCITASFFGQYAKTDKTSRSESAEVAQ